MDDALWVNNNGMVVCLKHGGRYLQSSVEAEPGLNLHVTPLDVWMRADSAGSICDASCEVCSSRPLTVREEQD